MNSAIAALIVIVGAVSAIGWWNQRLIKLRHSLAPPAAPDAGEAQRIASLTDENAGLKRQLARVEERLQVLERIATDPAARTALEIENLR